MRAARSMMMGLLGGGAVAPAAISDLAATANLNGTVVVSWTLPEGATKALIRYNVDQAAAPAAVGLGIGLGLIAGTSVVLTGVEYGATYRFSAWAWNEGGYAASADTASATGPFNPLAYSSHLALWLDARRQTPVDDNSDLATPTDYSGNSVSVSSSAASPPHYIVSGINSLPTFRWLSTDAGRQWSAGDVDFQGAGGLSVAVLEACESAADTSEKTIISKWETAGPSPALRAWKLTKGAGEVQLYLSNDGTLYSTVDATSSDNTTPHGLVGVWKPSTYAALYRDGVEDDYDATITYASLFDTSEPVRIGGARNNTGDDWLGDVTVFLVYSEALSRMAGILLSDHLAAVGGV